MTDAPSLQRDDLIAAVEDADSLWDVLVIGGGATGLGTAVDAAARGFRTLLLEQSDFGKGTSSRSTKLVHGGVRYLRQGNVSLVFEALEERGLLLRNAPHLATNQQFVVPCYRWYERAFYGSGLKLYDAMARDLSLGPSKILSRERVRSCLPTVRSEGLRGGILYHDGQFDDARLTVNLAQTAIEHGAIALNYFRVDGLEKKNGRISGVVATDVETGREYTLSARAVVNATGVFADMIRRIDQPHADEMIRPSQGIHIVVDRTFLPGHRAMMIPRTEDGRVLFAVPWRERLLIGTTDTPLERIDLEPRPLESEIAYLLEHANRYLDKTLHRSDIRSTFAGLRPLVSSSPKGETSAISRDHTLCVSKTGLITITGGKWTTYRRMAQETIDEAIRVASLEDRPCPTEQLRIHGWRESVDGDDPFAIYGSDAEELSRFLRSTERGEDRLHERLNVRRGEVRWAVRREMARTVEDVLSRRTRALVLDAEASREAAHAVAEIMADELGRGPSWVEDQTEAFDQLAEAYLPAGRTQREESRMRAE